MLKVIEQGQRRLKSCGLERGDRVAIIASGNASYACFICACWSLGITVVPLNKKQPRSFLDNILADVNPKLVVADDLSLFPDGVELKNICSTESDLFNYVSLADLDLDYDSTADIIFTSGSSGEAKGVVHTVSNHYYSALGAHEVIPFAEGDTWIVSLPFYHISGLSLIMRSLIHGGALYFPPLNCSIDNCLNLASHISLVPAQLARLLRNSKAAHDLSLLRAILVGGAPLNMDLRQRASDLGLALFTTYGSSEMSSQITTTRSGRAFYENCSGQLLAEGELAFAEDREILVRGKTLCSGYLKGSILEPVADSDGWFHTGDVGYMNEEGELFVQGRKDLMFISGGENIFPEEIEAALELHPRICRAVVVPKDDFYFGQRPVVFIKFDGEAVDIEELKVFLKDKLVNFKIPVAILPWPDSAVLNIKVSREHFRLDKDAFWAESKLIKNRKQG